MLQRIISSEMPRTAKVMLNKTKKPSLFTHRRLSLPARKELQADLYQQTNGGKIRAGWGDPECTNIDPCSPQFP